VAFLAPMIRRNNAFGSFARKGKRVPFAHKRSLPWALAGSISLAFVFVKFSLLFLYHDLRSRFILAALFITLLYPMFHKHSSRRIFYEDAFSLCRLHFT